MIGVRFLQQQRPCSQQLAMIGNDYHLECSGFCKAPCAFPWPAMETVLNITAYIERTIVKSNLQPVN